MTDSRHALLYSSTEMVRPMSSLVMPNAFSTPKLHRKTVGVPSGFALYALSFECAVAAKNVLEGAGHDMVNAGLAVGRRGAFKEDESVVGWARLHTPAEYVTFLPLLHHLLCDARKVEGASFGKSSGHRAGQPIRTQGWVKPVARR